MQCLSGPAYKTLDLWIKEGMKISGGLKPLKTDRHGSINFRE